MVWLMGDTLRVDVTMLACCLHDEGARFMRYEDRIGVLGVEREG